MWHSLKELLLAIYGRSPALHDLDRRAVQTSTATWQALYSDRAAKRRAINSPW